jgi:hypothetical protein
MLAKQVVSNPKHYFVTIKQCQSHLPKERPCSLTAYTLLDSHIYINIIITNRSPGMFCRNIFPCQVRQRHMKRVVSMIGWAFNI